MAYQPTDWSNNRAPGITAQALDKIEQGIKAAHDEIESRSGTSVSVNGVTADEDGNITLPIPDAAVVDSLAQVLIREQTQAITSTAGTLAVPAGATSTPTPVGISGATDHASAVSGGVLAPVTVTAVQSRTSAGSVVSSATVSPSLVLRDLTDDADPAAAYRDVLAPDGTLTRRVGVRVIDGTHPLTVRSSGTMVDTLGVFTPVISGMLVGHTLPGRANNLPVGSYFTPDVEGIQIGLNNGALYIRVNRSRLTTQDLDGVRAWLNANPITLFYPLAAATTEQVTAPAVTPSAGGTIVAVSATTPRGMAATVTTTSSASVVQLLNGKEPVEGAVTLTASDVGADPAGTAQGLIDNLELPGADLVEFHDAVIESRLTTPLSSDTGELDLPATSLGMALKVTVAGSVNHAPAITGGTLDPVSFTTVTSRDADGTTVDTATYDAPVVLRDLADGPDAIRDTLNDDGTLTRRVGTLVLNGTESWTLRGSGTFTDTIGVYTSPIADLKRSNAGPGRTDRFDVDARYFSDDDEGMRVGTDNDRLYLRIDRARLTTQDVAGVKAWLAANPTTVFYEKATPVTETPTRTGAVTATAGGTVTVESGVPAKVATRVATGTVPWMIDRHDTLFTVPTMPSGFPMTTPGMYALYDELMAAHPDYITMNLLGVDALGNEVREYVFAEPTMPNVFDIAKPKFSVTSGLHGNEKSPAMGLWRFVTALADLEGDNDTLARFRAAVDLHVVPVACPSGWNAHTRVNHNGVNINRNFTTHWSDTQENPGTGPASEDETQILEAWWAGGGFDYYLDCHWAGQVGNRVAWSVIGTASPDAMRLREDYAHAMHRLSLYWPRRWSQMPKGVNFGELVPYSLLAQAQEQAAATGINALLMEFAAPVTYVDPPGSSSGGNTITMTAEYIANGILTITRRHY